MEARLHCISPTSLRAARTYDFLGRAAAARLRNDQELHQVVVDATSFSVQVMACQTYLEEPLWIMKTCSFRIDTPHDVSAACYGMIPISTDVS